MAYPAERYLDNAPGDFFVDRTCIDCDACRRIAPGVFRGRDHSYVARQPESEAVRPRAMMALVACPTGSIGTVSRQDARPGIAAFPEPVAQNVSFCGFTSEASFGAWSYFIERPAGNVLVDSPRAVHRLLRTSRNAAASRRCSSPIATTSRTTRRSPGTSDARRVLHERDVTRRPRGVERPLSGDEPVRLDDDLLAIPTPGHTRGHAVLLYREKFLFTGDHLAWSSRRGGCRLPGRLLVFLAGADPLDGAPARLSVRVGPPRPRSVAPRGIRRRHEKRTREMHPLDEGTGWRVKGHRWSRSQGRWLDHRSQMT